MWRRRVSLEAIVVDECDPRQGGGRRRRYRRWRARGGSHGDLGGDGGAGGEERKRMETDSRLWSKDFSYNPLAIQFRGMCKIAIQIFIYRPAYWITISNCDPNIFY
jgi:hypothetical protein